LPATPHPLFWCCRLQRSPR